LRAQEFEGEFANEGGKIGDARWFDERKIDTAPSPVMKRVRFWDLAATEKKAVGIGSKRKEMNDPDETVGSLISKFRAKREEDGRQIERDNFCIEHQVGGYWGWDALLDAIVNTARHDGPDVVIVLEEEPGSGGKNQVAAVKTHIKRFPELSSVQVIGQRARDVGDRVMAANHWFGIAADGRMWLVKGDWNKKFLGQLDGFTQVLHDDRVTSVTGGMTYLSPFASWARVPFLSV
jgi:phage terminase large subunit-like protein